MTSLEQEFLQRIEKHKGIIYKISKMYMDNSEDQNDLFQEIIYKSWKAYPSFEGRSQFSTWLYRVAINTAIVFMKSEKKRSFVKNEENLARYKINIEEYVHETEEKIRIMYECIHQLKPIEKALIFYYLEDFSGREMAQELGISEVNARVKLTRAKEKLKTLIEKRTTNF